ncbi:hypothetical protein OIV83_002732 [Microbotryomycetes sp. JL201]|nr:hypothetical protein OIV83_002732 [Microbotryomycetes sp. JL201]
MASVAAASSGAAGAGSSTSIPPRQTDVRRRAVLPKTLQNMQQTQASLSASSNPLLAALDLPSDEYLDKLEEELNRRVDQDTETLVEGMADLVKMAHIEGKDHYRVAQDAFHANVRTESMIRAAHSLISLSHTLKLLHLFSDTATAEETRERLAKQLDTDIETAKAQVRSLVSGTKPSG